jgi:dTDP-4-amino-4,6-dideoxygalactose transaminase
MLIEYGQVDKAITNRTKAVIMVSLFGNPLDYDKLIKFKEKHDLYIIEDAACAIGAKYGSIFAGNFADISVFSFHPRKFITTGEGGMITTNHKVWADFARSYKKHGISVNASNSPIEFERIGSNYKLSDILSAVGLGQMDCIEQLLQRRFVLVDNYKDLLKRAKKIAIPEITSKGLHSYQSFCVLVKNARRLIEPMGKIGVQVQIGTYALHQQKAFSNNPSCRFIGEMTGSEITSDTCLALPLYHDLTFQEQQYVVENLIALDS